MPRTTRTTERSVNQVLKTLDDIRLTMNDVKFSVRLMAVHQEAMIRTIQRWVHRQEQQESERIWDAVAVTNAKLKRLFPPDQRQGSPEASSESGQRQGSPEASREPERSRVIAGPSTPASSSGSIM